ncbi:sensor domain-containing diguanylate cyclase [Tsukamurella paurometabola]|uniref:Probable diguanylate cyclase YeaP n=1 Tax=Tsukamurella paurometabola TaxID=2061 RepID=A0A3P8MCQ5_TSUPA|nr:GGDEF domain-containing protein [Tsukamurella paurometabola]UEA83731.1 GGDEF domain-containing protein [Tsukamurella paurometabola]VDR40870.1 Probable diguanylate cyclase YeaP [Tsukamurella paurometabola]
MAADARRPAELWGPVGLPHLLRAGARALTRRSGWRYAGRAEYEQATSWIKGQGGGIALRFVVGSLALLMVPLCIGVLFSDARPRSTAAMIVFVVAASGSAVLGTWWLRLRRPRAQDAMTFVAIADICLLTGCLAQFGIAKVAGTTYLGMLAMLTAFLLGWRILVVHCLFSLAAIAACTVAAVQADGVAMGQLYAILAPAATIDFALPMLVQFIVEFGRRGIGVVTVERNRDTLTGLFSRAGLQATLRGLVHRREHDTAVVAILDLDGFKAYNDTYGHLAGDKYLAETAQWLRGGLSSALIGRMGGDEFVIVALRLGRTEADVVIGDLRRLVDEGGPIAGSIGLVVRPRLSTSDLPSAVGEADRALYTAKADRSRRLVVRDLTVRDADDSD